MSPEAPPKILVERYLIEIARNYNVPYEPDQSVMLVSCKYIVRYFHTHVNMIPGSSSIIEEIAKNSCYFCSQKFAEKCSATSWNSLGT